MENFSEPQIKRVAKWLKVLAEPNRLLILNKIIQGVQCNCEMGDALNMAPNLISHHLGILRDAGILNVERDPVDARWGYYSVNLAVLHEINQQVLPFFDPERIQPRKLTCGPKTEPCK